jgi:hypothetical protein
MWHSLSAGVIHPFLVIPTACRCLSGITLHKLYHQSPESLFVHTYREHHQLAGMIQDLAGLIEEQSSQLAALARRKAIPADPAADSPLLAAWTQLGSAFQLLASHASSLQAEFDRLQLAPPTGKR